MKIEKLSRYIARLGLILIAMALLAGGDAGAAPSPTLRMAVQRSTNRVAVVQWGPPAASLQIAPTFTGGGFTNVLGATTPYVADTRLATTRGYRACLPALPPTIFTWRDTIVQPGKMAIEWTPRNYVLEESLNLFLWHAAAGAPAVDWYYPPTPVEGSPGSLQAGARYYRLRDSPGGFAPAGNVYSVNVVGYVNLLLRTSQSNYISFPLIGTDQSLNTLLPLPAEASGTYLQFFNQPQQQLGPHITFTPALGGWVNPDGTPALKPGNQSACMLFAQSSVPAATTVLATLVGEVAQGTLVRPLPAGWSLNGPPVPQVGGITTVHALPPNDGDVLLLYNLTTHIFDSYFYTDGFWDPAEPVVGVGSAFFYYNSGGAPINWVRVFSVF